MKDNDSRKALNSSELVLDSEEHCKVHMLIWTLAEMYGLRVSENAVRSSHEVSQAPVLLTPSATQQA